MKTLIAVLALWRDSSDHMKKTLDQLSKQEKSLSNEYSFIYSFYENDSKDDTAEILANWLEGKLGFLNSEARGDPNWGSIAFRRRTQYMAHYRNVALEALADYDYRFLFVIDTDIIYEHNFLKKLIHKLESNPHVGIITPNTIQFIPDQFGYNCKYSYFDSWALIDKHGNQGISFSKNPFILNKDRISWDNDLSVYVNSAFGGAALMRGDLIRKNNLKWNGDAGCEHWRFCESVIDLNYMVVVDPLIKAEAIHYKNINLDWFKLKYDFYRLQKNNLKGYKKLLFFKKLFINFMTFLFSSLIKVKILIKGFSKIIANKLFH